MSLILAGLVFAGTSGALFVGRWIKKRRAALGEAPPADPNAPPNAGADVPPPPPPADDESAKKTEEKKKPARVLQGDKPQLDGFVCQLGDVLMRLTGEEAWLAGGVVMSEDLPVAVLFVAPDAGHDCVIYVRSRPKSSLFWLEPLDPKAVLVGGEPPSSVEHGGIRFDRARRLPLRSKRIGVGAPDVGDAVMIAEYASAGSERLLVLKANSGTVCCYRGLELEEGSFEVIASGASTLES